MVIAGAVTRRVLINGYGNATKIRLRHLQALQARREKAKADRKPARREAARGRQGQRRIGRAAKGKAKKKAGGKVKA
jgi:hypothetical protein